jgi:hypothetical protein
MDQVLHELGSLAEDEWSENLVVHDKENGTSTVHLTSAGIGATAIRILNASMFDLYFNFSGPRGMSSTSLDRRQTKYGPVDAATFRLRPVCGLEHSLDIATPGTPTVLSLRQIQDHYPTFKIKRFRRLPGGEGLQCDMQSNSADEIDSVPPVRWCFWQLYLLTLIVAVCLFGLTMFYCIK